MDYLNYFKGLKLSLVHIVLVHVYSLFLHTFKPTVYLENLSCK